MLIPWYSLKSIDFLSEKDFSQKNILEFGAGQSTLWWAERCKKIISFEPNQGWYRKLKKEKEKYKNLEIYLAKKLIINEEYIKDQLFDVIIIDGLDRIKCAQIAFHYLNKDGLIILDDTQEKNGRHCNKELFNLLKKNKFQRIDFCDFDSNQINIKTTSFFFKNSCFLETNTNTS